jgi:diguanylate cyclase (GGDEF)-like protein
MPGAGQSPQVRSRRLIASRRRVIVAVAASLIVLPILANMWAIHGSRRAMVTAVEKAELAAARSAAIDTSTNVRTAINEADAAARRPGLANRVKARDHAGLMSALDPVSGVGLFRGFVIFDNQGVLAATGTSGLLGDPAAWQPGLHAVAGEIVYTTPVSDDKGRTVGGLAAELDLDRLLAQLTNTRYGRSGAAALVTPDGLVVTSGMSNRRGSTVQAPVLRTLITRHREGVAQHWEPVLRNHQITAVAPVEGVPWSVLVGADEAEAYQPAAALGRRLTIGFIILFVVSGLLVVAMVRLVTTNRRALERLGHQARRLALTDPLTGVANRRALEDHLAVSLPVAETVGDPLTVTLVDLDGLKHLNDRFGHQAGDRSLCDLARALSAAVRDTDLVARLGGDEFAIVQRGVDASAARDVVERLRTSVAIPGLSGHALSFSAGVAGARPGEDAAAVLARADRALYAEKRARRQHVATIRL